MLVGVYLCGAAFLLASSPDVARVLGQTRWALTAIAGMGPVLFLIATRRAFGAAAQLSARTIGAMALGMSALVAAPAFAGGASKAWIAAIGDAAILLLFAAAALSTFYGYGDDLDPRRRSMRLALLTAGACLGIAVAAAALFDRTGAVSAGFRELAGPFTSGAALLMVGVLAAGSLRLKDDEPRRKEVRPDGSPLARKILAILEADRAYRAPELTLSELARRLEAPEHQIRAAINSELGFRNFSAFVNSYRLRDVIEALRDKAQGETPIATIALDAGFGSIASFNRVFKAETGKTPNEFRREAAAA